MRASFHDHAVIAPHLHASRAVWAGRLTRVHRAGLRTVLSVMALVGAPSVARAQPGTGTLSLETVAVAPPAAYLPPGLAFAFHESRVTVLAEGHGRQWRRTLPFGRAHVPGLPAGRYRVTVTFDRDRVAVVLGVPIEANRPTQLRVYKPAVREQHLTAERMSATASRKIAHTFVAVPEPTEVAWPVRDACTEPATDAGGPPPDALVVLEPLRTSPVSTVWADLRDWWGGFSGTLRAPDGHAIMRAPVAVEFLDTGAAAPSRAPFRQRSTETGCVGLAGVWPGGYRLVIDRPPLALVASIDVTSGDAPAPPSFTLRVVPRVRSAPRLAIDSPRLGRVQSVEALRGVVEQLEATAATPAEIVDLVGQAVWWHVPSNWRGLSPVAGAQVTLVHERTGRQVSTVTDEHGDYRLPVRTGIYRVAVESQSFRPLRARVIVTPEGHAVLDGFRQAGDDDSGVWMPGATLASGLMTALHLDLSSPIVEQTAGNGATVTVEGRSAPAVAAPLALVVTRPVTGVGPPASLWTTPLTHNPLSGRTVQGVHPLTPGIVYTEPKDSLAEFTAAGLRRFFNRLTIDGIAADLGLDLRGHGGIGEAPSGALPAFATTGSTQTLVPVDAIDDIHVDTIHATPELARSSGAQTRIVTRAGPDRFSGTAFADIRPDALSATDFFDKATGLRRQRRLFGSGLSLGGPLPLPKTHYWLTYERQHVDRSVVMTMPVPSLATRDAAPPALRPLLDAFPQPTGGPLSEDEYGPGLAAFTGEVPATSALSVLSARFDVNPSGATRVAVRANHGRSRGTSITADRQLPFSFDSAESATTTTATAILTRLFSSILYDVRLNATRHGGSIVMGAPQYGGAQTPSLAALVPPGVSPADTWLRIVLFDGSSGGLNVGRSGGAVQTQVQLLNTWTLPRGTHEWKFGLDYRRVVASTDHAQHRYTYRFADLNAFIRSRPSVATLDHFGHATASLLTVSAFAQDTWRPSQRLTFTYGFRYGVKPAPVGRDGAAPLRMRYEALPDLQEQPASDPLWPTSWTDLAPRAAASYRLGTDAHATIVRAGWSLTFDELTNPGAIAFGRGYPYRSRQIFRPATFPASPGEIPVTGAASFAASPFAEAHAFSADLQSPRIQQWHLGVERELGPDQRAALAYVGTGGRHLPYASLYYTSERQDHLVHAVSNDGRSNYHALLAEYTRRVTGGLQARVAYTWSHALDNDSGESAAPNLPVSLSPAATNYASADFDRRHVFFAALHYQFPAPRLTPAIRRIFENWSLDMACTIQSGAPFTVKEPRNIGRGVERLRPDRVPDVPVRIDDASSPTGQRFNDAAFVSPTEPRQGNLGRNAFHSTPLRQIDVSLVRSISLTPSMRARVRLDLFNVFNIPNFGPPMERLGLEQFGRPFQTYADAMGTGTLTRGGLAPMQQAGGPRAIQLSVSLGWGR